LQMIYLEAGSGAINPVPVSLVKAVRQSISVPLAVGGGITNKDEVDEFFNAGVDLIILGNGCEKNPQLLTEACRIRDKCKGL
jgi:heptaprenylglyceryl phosphate synthase